MRRKELWAQNNQLRLDLSNKSIVIESKIRHIDHFKAVVRRQEDMISDLKYEIARDQSRTELLAELNEAHETIAALRHALTIPMAIPAPPITVFDLDLIINDLLCLKERLPS